MEDTSIIQQGKVTPPFEQHVRTVVRQVRVGLAEGLASIGADPTQSQAVARKLGLDKNLTWKISRIVRDENPCTAIPMMPGKAGLRIFCDAIAKAGASPKAVTTILDAAAELEELITLHAGDRETFEVMLGNLAQNAEGQQQIEAQRRLAFKGNSAIWGVQARVQLCVNVIAPGKDEDWVDLAWLSGLVDFRRLRADAVWPIAATRKIEDDGKLLPVGEMEPLDPAFAGPNMPPLFGEFCSRPLADINLENGPDGLMRYQLLEGPVGNTAATTCIIGIRGRRFLRRYRVPNDTIGEHGARLYTPAELLLHDLYVHRDLDYAMSPEVCLYNQLPCNPPYPSCGRDRGRLPLLEKMLDLGGGPPDMLTPELPHYRAMLERVFERTGWNARDFHGFRFKMRYPPIPTLAFLRYALPARPSR